MGKKVVIEFDEDEIKVMVAEILANKLTATARTLSYGSIKRDVEQRVIDKLAEEMMSGIGNA